MNQNSKPLSTGSKPLEIVLVDDEPEILEVIAANEILAPYKVTPFRMASHALNYIAATPSVAIIITDYLMPKFNGAQLIAAVKDIDPFLPALCLTGCDQAYVGKDIVRGGGLDVVIKTDIDELKQKIETLLQSQYPRQSERKTIILKIGGSVQEKDVPISSLYDSDSKAILNTVKVTQNLQNQGYQMIITSGADPYGTIEKARFRKYLRLCPELAPELIKHFSRQIKKALDSNIEFLCTLFSQDSYFIFNPSSLASYNSLEKALQENKIILTSVAPRHLSLEDLNLIEDEYNSPVRLLAESDYQALLIAKYFGQQKLILVKDTPGIFKFDPLRGKVDGQEAWRETQMHNERYEHVFPSWFFENKISRVGTDDQDGHLLENAALHAVVKYNMEVPVVCPEYSQFVSEKNDIFDTQLFHTSLDDQTYLERSILAAIGENKWLEPRNPVSRIKPSLDS